MKMIIHGFHDPLYFPIISKMVGEFSIDYCHIIYGESKIELPSSVTTIFHKADDISWGKYEINWENITPLDEEVIESMRNCEAVTLKMMDRLELVPLSYGERKRLYLKHLRYWNHILVSQRVDLFVSCSPPHEIYDFVIYNLCKLKKIPTIFFHQLKVPDTVMIMEDWKIYDARVKERYQQLVKQYAATAESEITLTGRFKDDFDRNTAQQGTTPFYMLRKKEPHTFIRSLRTKVTNLDYRRAFTLVKEPRVFVQKVSDNLTQIRQRKALFKFYQQHETTPDLSKKFIYFPLHLQPEASTSPLASVFVDQILIVQMIARYLPQDVYLYIKENPHQTQVGRDIEFYRELLRIPQVRLVPISFDTFELIRNCLAVATATGTAGWEALYRLKPVLLFGHSFYQYAPGVSVVREVVDCEEAIRRILSNEIKFNLRDMKLYLKALEQYTIEGYIDSAYQKISHVSESLSNENILNALIDKITLIRSL